MIYNGKYTQYNNQFESIQQAKLGYTYQTELYSHTWQFGYDTDYFKIDDIGRLCSKEWCS